MEQVNVFHKGIVSDIAYSKRDNQSWDFPTLGVRIINRAGQGLVVSAVEGNEYEFSVSEGYYVLAAKEYEGILYILSVKPASFGGNIGEIGVYPSPKEWSVTNTEFEKTYKYLHNYTNGRFATPSFDFPLDKSIDLMIKSSYDDSVDLYICDGTNPNRVINSGFKRTGEYTNRVYNADYFKGAMNLIPASYNMPIISLATVEGGGMLRPGTYFVYIRYCTQDFARTNFLIQSNPIVVYENSTPTGIQGLQEKDWGTLTEYTTSKRIALEISNLNPTFKYFELAILRYSNAQENGAGYAYYGLIDQRYLIDGSSADVLLTGMETYLNIDRVELDAERMPYDISQSIDQIADRLVGANWRMRNQQYDRAKFAEFAQMVSLLQTRSIKNCFGGSIGESHYALNDGYAGLYGMSDYKMASENSGYFRGQIYPFSLQYVFDDNTVTDAFPVKGNIIDPVTGEYNLKGLYKFGSWNVNNDRMKTIGIKFVFDAAAKAFFEANSGEGQAFDHVIGFRLLRGDRIDNLIGQGLLLPTYDGIVNKKDGGVILSTKGINNIGEEYDEGSAYSIPLIYGAIPLMSYSNPTNNEMEAPMYCGAIEKAYKPSAEEKVIWDQISPTTWNSWSKYTYCDSKRRANKFGLFCADMFFDNNINIPEDLYIEPCIALGSDLVELGDGELHPRYTRTFFHFNGPTGGMHGRIRPFIGGMEHKVNIGVGENPSYTYPTPEYVPVKAALIDRFTWKGPMNMKSWVKPNDINELEENANWKVTTRSYVVNRYIGIQCDETYLVEGNNVNKLEPYIYGIVNIYKNKNDDDFAENTVRAFNVASTLYRYISQFITLQQAWNFSRPPMCFQGDCYYHKTWFRHGRFFGYEGANVNHKTNNGQDDQEIDYVGDGIEFVDHRNAEQLCWQYGSLIGIITENKFNTAARNDVYAFDNNNQKIKMTFFPKSVVEFGDWVHWTVLRDRAENEAFQINSGYHQPLIEKRIPGYDPALITSVEYRKPNRDYFSEKHIPGAYMDGWRHIKPSYYKDYCPENGQIIATRSIGNYLVSIMEYAIIRHFYDDRVMKTDEQLRIILGSSFNFLSDNYIKIASFGSVHKHSLVKSDFSLYGIDMKRGIIWRVVPTIGNDGNMFLIAEDIGQKHGIVSWMEEKRKDYIYRGEFTDEEEIIEDERGITPTEMMIGNGISAGFNKLHKEIYFTFLWKNQKVGSSLKATAETLVYSEVLQAFIGTFPFQSMVYFTWDDRFMSTRYDVNTDTGAITATRQVYAHDHEAYPNKFYETIYPCKLTFIVNGLTPDGSLFKFEKVFEALQIVMNKTDLISIQYETEGQVSIYEFKTLENDTNNHFWEHALYNENKWEIPIIKQEFYGNNPANYEMQSDVRGKYVKITITFAPNDTLRRTIIENITTMFNISNA